MSNTNTTTTNIPIENGRTLVVETTTTSITTARIVGELVVTPQPTPLPTPPPTPIVTPQPTPQPTTIPTPIPTPLPTPEPELLPTKKVQGKTIKPISGNNYNRWVRFGHVFNKGEVFTDDDYIDQLDVKTLYDDGSFKWTIVTRAVDNYTISDELRGVPVNFDIPDVALSIVGINREQTIYLQDELLNKRSEAWRDGKYVTERCFEIISTFNDNPIRFVINLSCYVDGSWDASIEFRNDIGLISGYSNQFSSNPVDYHINAIFGIHVNDETVHSGQGTLHQYQAFRQHIYSNNCFPQFVAHDIKALVATGAVAKFKLDPTLAIPSEWYTTMYSDKFLMPTATNGINKSFGDTGLRDDIGVTTRANVTWLSRQDEDSYTYAIAQAEASASIPWNRKPFNSFASCTMPGINVSSDFSATNGGRQGFLTQTDVERTGWKIDDAHMPELCYYPALLTGDSFYMRQLHMQAAWYLSSGWIDPRGNEKGYLINWFNQVRGQAWPLHLLGLAAYLSINNTLEGDYFRSRFENNLTSWLNLYAGGLTLEEYKDLLYSNELNQLPTSSIISKQGELYGWFIGDYGTHGVIAGWQFNFMYMCISDLVWKGFDNWKIVLHTMDNFNIKRVTELGALAAAQYNTPIRPNDVFVTTWNDMRSVIASDAYSWTVNENQLYTPDLTYTALYLSSDPNAKAAMSLMHNYWGDRAINTLPQMDLKG